MTTARRLFSALALAVAVGGAVGAWRAVHAARTAAAAASLAGREREGSARAARALESKIAATEQQRDVLVQERDKLNAAASAPKPPASAPARPPSRLNSPEAQAKMVREFRAGLRFEHLAFYRSAGLSDAQIESFENILTEHDGRRRDIQVATREQQLSSRDPAIVALTKEEEERYARELNALLGENTTRRFTAWQGEAPDRRSVADVAGNLALTPTPLTPEQGRQLTALFHELSFSKRQDEPAMWDELLRRGESLLSAPQLAELRALRTAKSEIAFNEFQRAVQKVKK